MEKKKKVIFLQEQLPYLQSFCKLPYLDSSQFLHQARPPAATLAAHSSQGTRTKHGTVQQEAAARLTLQQQPRLSR